VSQPTYQRVHLGHVLPSRNMQGISDIPSVVVDDMPPVRPTVRDTAATPCTRHLANDRRSLGRLTEILVGFLEPSSVPVKHLVAVRRHVLVMLVPQLLVPKNVTGT
jgi:hypothetical protein